MRTLIFLGALAALVSPLTADSVYVETHAGAFGTYDVATNVFTILGTSSSVIYGLAFDDGILYGNDNGNADSGPFFLHTVDTSNGALASVGQLNNSCGVGALASAPGGGSLYFADGADLCNGNLYSVNSSTAAVTAVGPLGFTVNGSWDFNYGPDGNLYYSTEGDLYRVDGSTGAGTLVGAFGDGLQMGVIFAEGNVLYGFGGLANSLYSISTNTGTATFIQDLPSSASAGFTAATVGPSSPEPSSIWLLLVGLTLIGCCLGRAGRGLKSQSQETSKIFYPTKQTT